MFEFWADKVAGECINRAEKEGRKQITVKCGASPSGGKHIGNLNDVIRAHFVYLSLKDSGCDVRLIHTSDDRDPLRKIPSRLPDLGGEWKEITQEDSIKLEKYLGFSYVSVPDPFGCCSSWAHHFNKVWMDGAKSLGIKIDDFSNDDLYKKGKFDDPIRMALKDVDFSRTVISKYQRNIKEDWYPITAVCENCGRINGRVTSANLDDWSITYSCETRVLGNKGQSEGCSHSGTTSISNGKLSWRFEWPAQWFIFDVLHEPFGKDHAEGSWPSGQAISRGIYNREPPVPFTYEFFLINGKKMSASTGNVYITQDMLKFLEPEVFLYFYTKKPAKQRDLDMDNIFRLVNEFDEIEDIYFGLKRAEEREEFNAKRSYFLSCANIPKTKPLRISYTFASMIAQTSKDGGLSKALVFLGAKDDTDDSVKSRLDLANYWVTNLAPDSYRIEIKPDKDAVSSLSDEQKKALKILRMELEKKDWNADDLQTRIYNISKESGISAPKFFESIYLSTIGSRRGPRAGHFIAALGVKEVADVLKELGF